MSLETVPFDAAEFLDAEGQAELVENAFASGSPACIKHALNVLARARGMSKVAREANVTREGLYKSLASDGDPRLSTFLGVIKALGLKLSVSRIKRLDERSHERQTRQQAAALGADLDGIEFLSQAAPPP